MFCTKLAFFGCIMTVNNVFFSLFMSVVIANSNELSQTNNWVNVWNIDWVYNSAEQSWTADIPGSGKGAELVMETQHWYNADGLLRINYTFSIDSSEDDSHSSIILYNSQINSGCQYYYIRVTRVGITLRRGDYNIEAQLQILASSSYPFQWINNEPYTISITVSNRNEFDIKINDIPSISHIDTTRPWIMTTQNGYSGYVGLTAKTKNDRLVTKAIALSISGTPETVTKMSWQCKSPAPTAATSAPSPAPTNNPTPSPTLNPNRSPTNHPSKPPTLIPSSNPTENPTNYPTKIPTKNPTSDPSIEVM